MSQLSSDGYERLLDYVDDQLQRPVSPQPPPHIGLPIPPYPAPLCSTASGGGAGSSTITQSSRGKPRKGATQKKGRRMTWLLIHNTGETQTLQLDKRMLVQVHHSLNCCSRMSCLLHMPHYSRQHDCTTGKLHRKKPTYSTSYGSSATSPLFCITSPLLQYRCLFRCFLFFLSTQLVCPACAVL